MEDSKLLEEEITLVDELPDDHTESDEADSKDENPDEDKSTLKRLPFGFTIVNRDDSDEFHLEDIVRNSDYS